MKEGRNYRSFMGIISFIFIMMFCISASAYATDLVVENVSGFPGDDIVVSVSLQGGGSNNVAGAQFDVIFDDSKLTFQSATIGSAADAADKDLSSSSPASDTVRCLIVGMNRNVIADGDLVELSFRIKDGAAQGAYEISLEQVMVPNIDAQSVTVGVTTGFVTVQGDSPADLSLNPASLSIAQGSSKTAMISGGTAPYSIISNNSSVASVQPSSLASEGQITVNGIAGGSTIINVIDSNGDQVSLNVTVTSASLCDPAVLTDDLLLQVPQLLYQTLFGAFGLWVEFEYVPEFEDSIVFMVSNFGIIDDEDLDTSCQSASLNDALELQIPRVNFETLFGTMQIWIDFDYLYADEDDLLFQVTNFGFVD
ncbi:exported hypothetical protein [Desulfamplus magnetovallimortis]|uniref:Cohesin domain-containing protein n=1 Tax=Desulfamplus magnetovallimortis TaxID=1246637 RepID=A0A1W1HAL2_9BACT|nr:cohesin domain-containing protein [Desulfamplus magnetovallimortis]SLM29520.1 exported hypothetical protein [Desulfamplus magnetovallimortis]